MTYFICKTCRQIIAQGKCGEHRINTLHKVFDVYEYGLKTEDLKNEN